MKKIKKVAGYIVNFIWNVWSTLCIVAVAWYAVTTGRPVQTMSYILLSFILVGMLKIVWDKNFIQGWFTSIPANPNAVCTCDEEMEKELADITEFDIINGLCNYIKDLESLLTEKGIELPRPQDNDKFVGKVKICKVEKRESKSQTRRKTAMKKAGK